MLALGKGEHDSLGEKMELLFIEMPVLHVSQVGRKLVVLVDPKTSVDYPSKCPFL